MTCTQCKTRPSIAATDEVHLCAECLAATKPTLIFTDSPCSLESLVDELRQGQAETFVGSVSGMAWMRVSEHERLMAEATKPTGRAWVLLDVHERIVSELKAKHEYAIKRIEQDAEEIVAQCSGLVVKVGELIEGALLMPYPDTTCGVCGASATNMHGTFLCPTCYQAERS